MKHDEVFANLKALVGDWHGVNEEGQPVAVNYSLSANDSVLVERWLFHNGMDALTLYHLDGAILIATHYCPLGNQPRLELKDQAADGTLEFQFVSATNLARDEDEHEHRFDLRVIDAKTFRRNETYLTEGVPEVTGTTFHRRP